MCLTTHLRFDCNHTIHFRVQQRCPAEWCSEHLECYAGETEVARILRVEKPYCCRECFDEQVEALSQKHSCSFQALYQQREQLEGFFNAAHKRNYELGDLLNIQDCLNELHFQERSDLWEGYFGPLKEPPADHDSTAFLYHRPRRQHDNHNDCLAAQQRDYTDRGVGSLDDELVEAIEAAETILADVSEEPDSEFAQQREYFESIYQSSREVASMRQELRRTRYVPHTEEEMRELDLSNPEEFNRISHLQYQAMDDDSDAESEASEDSVGIYDDSEAEGGNEDFEDDSPWEPRDLVVRPQRVRDEPYQSQFSELIEEAEVPRE